MRLAWAFPQIVNHKNFAWLPLRLVMALDNALQKLEYDRARLYAWGPAMVAYTVARTGFVTMPDATLSDFNPFELMDRKWPRGGAKEFIAEIKAKRVPRWLLALAPIQEIKIAAGEK